VRTVRAAGPGGGPPNSCRIGCTRTGTATLVGNGLPPHEAAAAAERIDRLVEAAKRAGHPGRRAQISADAYLGMLNGAFVRHEALVYRMEVRDLRRPAVVAVG
jgi:hypothetical protein